MSETECSGCRVKVKSYKNDSFECYCYLLVKVSLCYQYTMQDLLERVQASEEEIKAYLSNIHACQIEGKLRFGWNNN